jgi:two-component system phosphate regulon response regulator PhoB
MTTHILIVEDEPDIAELVRFHLIRAGLSAEICRNGTEALEALRKHPPSMVILDLMLPDMDGIEICKRLKSRQDRSSVPVLMLTAKSAESDRILGLELGADDYLPKPFSPRELVLRVQAILRRTEERPITPTPFNIGPLTLNLESHRAFIDKRAVDLTVIEFKLLESLVEKNGRVARREELLNGVWGYRYTGGTRTVDTHIQRLRGKLGKLSNWIETVRGVGYRFRDPDDEDR